MKTKITYFCTECGNETSKWYGKCPACGAWNSLAEEESVTKPSAKTNKLVSGTPSAAPSKLAEITLDAELRFSTGLGEFDRVLGGGVVAGSLMLVGGDPGIGKSTLLLQICQTMETDGKILYISGEESARQLKMRAERLGVRTDRLYIVSQVNTDYIVKNIDELSPAVVIVDSIQTMYSPTVTSAPGSVSQVRDVTMTLMRKAKEDGISIFVVGHVTKDGGIAGPKVLEHMVDCVLYFEGERHQNYRVLRGVKNRFGSTNEIGVFEMFDTGLHEVLNPSTVMLDELAAGRSRCERNLRTGGQPPPAGGDTGARCNDRLRYAAQDGKRIGLQPRRHVDCGSRKACRDEFVQSGRLCQCRRRNQNRRTGGRPWGDSGTRVKLPLLFPAERYGLYRRGRPDRGNPRGEPD